MLDMLAHGTARLGANNFLAVIVEISLIDI
ncbi:MAG: hypothetical protein ACJA13_000712 [Paraglaciecola sp.]|jgi:hypothetical protein